MNIVNKVYVDLVIVNDYVVPEAEDEPALILSSLVLQEAPISLLLL